MTNYVLRCSHPDCDRRYDDNDPLPRLHCDGELTGQHAPSLLRPTYEKRHIEIKSNLPGIFAYIDWLPVENYYLTPTLYELGRPFCYKSVGLAKRLDLDQLYIAFSGYWPQRGANLLTRTFKEFECQASIVRYLKNNLHGAPFAFVVASAGNTGNGYNLLSTLLDIPIYLVVPETGCEKLVLPFHTKPFLIAVRGDYSDAGAVAERIADRTGLVRDGGVRNVARRGGLGTAMLHAVAHPEQGLHRLYNHYFQAVGSGAGAIAAWEAVNLLIADGRFGESMTRMHIAQNAPFTPLIDSWETGKRTLVDIPELIARNRTASVTADVLTNRQPAYSLWGGIFDMLRHTNGAAWRVSNYQVFHAARIFRESEGVDIGPAAAVAVDALRQAVLVGEVKRDESVLLHITGGGKEIQYSRGCVYHAKPNIIVKPTEIDRVVAAIGEPERVTDPAGKVIRYVEP